MMAAAGFPEYIIAQYGGWTSGSTAMRRYTKATLETMELMSQQMPRGKGGESLTLLLNDIIRGDRGTEEEERRKHDKRNIPQTIGERVFRK